MTIDLTAAIDDVATIISGAPFPSVKSRGKARLVVEHVSPLIEAAVRESIARDIEKYGEKWDHSSEWRDGIEDAARIARGEQP